MNNYCFMAQRPGSLKSGCFGYSMRIVSNVFISDIAYSSLIMWSSVTH